MALLAPVWTRFRAFGGRLRDVVYPPSCILCGGAVAEAGGLCAPCWRVMPFIERPVCERYGTPLPVAHDGPLFSPAALADPPVFGRARAVARFDGPARDLVHRLKYGDRLDLAPAMGHWMTRSGHDLLAEATLLVPVPMHWFRLWRRHFNQAAELARIIGKETGAPVGFETLRRIRATRPQVGLTRSERAANLERAFAVPEAEHPLVAGARIVLIDDVMTTASTGNAAARALLRAGAASVDLLVFALVAKDG